MFFGGFFCLVVLLLSGAQAQEFNVTQPQGEAKCLSDCDDRIVCVTEGCLLGKLKQGNVQSYQAFLGIPYASPPVGNLRFQNPLAPERYDVDPRDSTYSRNKCMQTDYVSDAIEGSEDCLYLNVYRPQSRSGTPLPVLLFFHGGAFKFGSADPRYYGPDYFMDTEQVILVTVNYRLGVFGFLSSGDANAKGNYGLKDQNRALQWIRSNIINFGGDRDKITLWGESAGAAATHFHMMSDRSNGLFQKAIMTGGNALAPWALERNPQKQFRTFAGIAGISKASFRDTADIMREISRLPAREIQKYSSRMYQFHPITPTFRPVIEGRWSDAMIREDPKLTWARGSFQKRPFFFTLSTYEHGISADLYYNPEIRQRILDDFDNSLMDIGGICKTEVQQVKDYYFGGNPTEHNIFNITKFRRDRMFYVPGYELIGQYSKYPDQQNYPMDLLMFDFKSSFSMSQLYHPYTNLHSGPSKMDVLLYLFRFSALDSHFKRGRGEEAAKDLMISIWTQYIINGISRTEDYPLCSAAEYKQTGFCRYMIVNRRGEDAQLSITSYFEPQSIPIYQTLIKA